MPKLMKLLVTTVTMIGCLGLAVPASAAAAADPVCDPLGAPSMPLFVLATYNMPKPGLNVDWGAPQPCPGIGGTLQYDIFITIAGTNVKIDHFYDTGQPVYSQIYSDFVFKCGQSTAEVTVYAWSRGDATHSSQRSSGTTTEVANTGLGIC
ncbi:MAG: hypothetical protein QOD07_160 [Frankiaceae bacterium]|jgi:hypothetical protein|nr:hypothetical protein [Frankiaceae bacterium]